MERLSQIRFGENGTIIVTKYDGQPLIAHGKIVDFPINMWEQTDDFGTKVIQEEVELINRKIKIMLVEDEAIIAKYLKMELELEGFEVMEFIPTGEKAVELVGKENPDIVLMDIKLAGKMNGVQTAKYIIDNHKLPIIFMTSYSKLEISKKAKELNPAA